MKLGASIFPRKIIPIEESLDYFESNKYIDYMEIFHDYPNRDINKETDLIEMMNSYDLKYTVHAPFIEVNPASVNPALGKTAIDEIKRSVDLANTLDSDIVVIHPGRYIFGKDKEYMQSVYRIAEENLKAKSLRMMKDEFPETVALRISMSDYREQDWLVNIPLYTVCRVFD